MILTYSSFQYLLLFLSASVILYYLVPKKARWSVLLAASYVFYGINCSKAFPILIFTSAVVWICGMFLGKCADIWDTARRSLDKDGKKELKKQLTWLKRGIVAFGLLFIFGILAIVKYSPFVLSLFPKAVTDGINLKIIVPLGISYYTLQAASYIIDVYRGSCKADKNFFRIALFMSFFPQMVEGPIGRYSSLADKLWQGNKFNYDGVAKGLQLICWGLIKKLVVADRCNILVAQVFDNWSSCPGYIILLGSLAYTLQIYAEFSGCIDIVRGSAELFGISMAENFRRPFFSANVNEFWRRWHITLGAWLKDYVFYTVSLSKVFAKISKWTREHLSDHLGAFVPSAFALLFVWIGNGVWHGAGWKYLAYGMYYYVIMMAGMLLEPFIRKFFDKTNIDRGAGWVKALCVLRTICIVVIGMTMFRADTLPDFAGMIGRFFDAEAFYSGVEISLGIDIADAVIISVTALIMLFVSVIQEKGIKVRDTIAGWNIAARWAVYIGMILLVVVFGAYGAGYDQVDFIYGQF